MKLPRLSASWWRSNPPATTNRPWTVSVLCSLEGMRGWEQLVTQDHRECGEEVRSSLGVGTFVWVTGSSKDSAKGSGGIHAEDHGQGRAFGARLRKRPECRH